MACSAACGGGESDPGFPLGTWQLSAITFEAGEASLTADVSTKLSSIKFEFLADNQLKATGTSGTQNYTWSFDSSTNIISIEGTNNFSIEATMTEEDFSYKAYTITDMSATTENERIIAEMAANIFIQGQVSYDPESSLNVYFKFKKI